MASVPLTNPTVTDADLEVIRVSIEPTEALSERYGLAMVEIDAARAQRWPVYNPIIPILPLVPPPYKPKPVPLP